MDGASDEVVEQLKKILVLKNKFKLVPVMLTEDTACIEVSYFYNLERESMDLSFSSANHLQVFQFLYITFKSRCGT